MNKGLEDFIKLRKLLNENFDLSKGANDKLDIIEKQLKALEIIINSGLYIAFGDYLALGGTYVKLSKEECELLKEIIG